MELSMNSFPLWLLFQEEGTNTDSTYLENCPYSCKATIRQAKPSSLLEARKILKYTSLLPSGQG